MFIPYNLDKPVAAVGKFLLFKGYLGWLAWGFPEKGGQRKLHTRDPSAVRMVLTSDRCR